MKSTPLPDILGTRMVSLRSRSRGGGWVTRVGSLINCDKSDPCITDKRDRVDEPTVMSFRKLNADGKSAVHVQNREATIIGTFRLIGRERRELH